MPTGKIWICFSDPENDNIPKFNPSPKPEKWSPDNIYEWTPVISSPYTSDHTFTVAGIIVLTILIAGMAIFTKRRIFRKSGNSR